MRFICENNCLVFFVLILFIATIPANAQNIALPATGQTNCYNEAGNLIACSGTGQDGETQKGVKWPVPRFVDNEDGTITDMLTGLVWLADANCADSVGYDPDETGNGTMTWTNSLDFVAAANAGGHTACAAGHNDWRLPNVNELESLINAGLNTSDWLETKGFSNIGGNAFWSSTTSSCFYPDNGIFVGVSNGVVNNTWKMDVGRVWPVRGGPNQVANQGYPANPWASGQTETEYDDDDGDLQMGVSWPEPRFSDNEDGTVTDELTGLIWLSDANCIASSYTSFDSDGAVDWQSALNFVKGMNTGSFSDCNAGYTDWRLPNRRELRSLADYGQSFPSLPSGHPFSNLASGGYWTSSTYQSLASWAWYFFTRWGDLGSAPKTSGYYVLPVRGEGGSPASGPDIEIDSFILDFGNVPRNFTTSPQELIIGNAGLQTLNVSSMTITGSNGYSLDPSGGDTPCGPPATSIVPGESCTVGVTFTPGKLGELPADLTITSDDPDESSIDIALTGTGTNIFADQGLADAVRGEIGKPVEEITQADLEGMTSLTASDRDISSLSGLKYCTGLKFLVLSLNSIVDLAPLSGLQSLTFLNLYSNNIQDISALQRLSSLVYLNLARNEISGISTLSNLGNLTDLYLDKNHIYDITALQSLTNLINLGLSDNQISSLSALVDNDGLGSGDRIWLDGNPLDLHIASQDAADIRALEDRGGNVTHDPFLEDDFPWEMFIPAFTRPRPGITVTPSSHDFGRPYIGCKAEKTYRISNTGKVDLVITGFDFATGSVDFSFDANEETNGPLPWTLSPQEEVDVYVHYMPLDEFTDSAYLVILSNDRSRPEHMVQANGNGLLYGKNVDEFDQSMKSSADIIFTLDRSGSMSDDNALVVANFGTFINEMASLDLDYHIAVVVEDDGCVLGSDAYIDNTFSASDAESTFETMADIYLTLGTYGANTERGFSLAEAGLTSSNIGSGGCNEGMYRGEHAALFIVHVSDEPEQSVNPYTYYVSLFQGMKADPDDVVINAVAGDYPGGCGSASAGTGYYEATVATGGLFLSICATDWGSHLTQLAQQVNISVMNDSFELTQLPVPETIQVTVDGIRTTTGWQYDPTINSVVFERDHIPAGGSTVNIEYHLMPDCES